MDPPSEAPNRFARSMPTASITARMSSARSSRVAIFTGRSERPVPRLSKRMSRQNLLNRSKNSARLGISQSRSRCDIVPGHNDVERSVAGNLVGDANIFTAGVFRPGQHTGFMTDFTDHVTYLCVSARAARIQRLGLAGS